METGLASSTFKWKIQRVEALSWKVAYHGSNSSKTPADAFPPSSRLGKTIRHLYRTITHSYQVLRNY